MWDRFINYLTEFMRGLSNTTFTILASTIITLGFFFLGNFLKANKKEAPKVSKPSQILWSVVMLVAFVVVVTLRY
ncbi:MAG: hypothetical protein ACLRFE_00255 [Clostridia bacterium]